VDFVTEGKFREDLYYRLSVFPLRIESLRDRKQDILPLTEHMANTYCRRMNRSIVDFDDEAREALQNHSWPGNVRELENVVQRSLILQPGNIVSKEDLFLDPMETVVIEEEPEVVHENKAVGNLEENLKHKEFQLIIDVLKKERGSRSKTAEKLGISARTLRYKLAKMRDSGIDVRAELTAY